MNLPLSDSIKIIFEQVNSLTGKDVQLIEKSDMDTYASIKIARNKMPHHVMYYKPEHSGIINHLIAHECGHILRMYGVGPESRIVPYTDDRLKMKALKDIEPEIQSLSKTLPFAQLVQIANLWYAGVIKMLTNYPSDIMIEKWIYDEYPDLRPYQSQNLNKQYSEAVQELSPQVERMTPKRILRASAGMNYAYFHTLGAHLKDSHYLSRYDQSVHAAMGKRLLLLQQGVENSYKGDTKTVNDWAAALGLSEWFAWRDFEDVPDNYLGSFA